MPEPTGQHSPWSIRNVVLAATGASSLAAFLKFVVDNVSGIDVPPQAILFYIPMAAFVVYVAVVVVATFATTVGGDSGDTTMYVLGGIVGVAVAGFLIYQMLFVNLAPYESITPEVRIAGAVVGLLILIATVFVYQRLGGSAEP